MTGGPWFSVLVVANLLVVGFGLMITWFSYTAYNASGGDSAFRDSTLGFLLITVGGVLAPLYEFGVKGDYLITGDELLVLQIIEGSVIAVGLALLVLSVYSHSQASIRARTEVESDLDLETVDD